MPFLKKNYRFKVFKNSKLSEYEEWALDVATKAGFTSIKVNMVSIMSTIFLNLCLI